MAWQSVLRSWRWLVAGVALAVTGAGTMEAKTPIEGTVNFIRPLAGGKLELDLGSGTNHSYLEVENAGGNTPYLYSRIRAEADSLGPEKWTVSGMDQIQFQAGFQLPLVDNIAELRRRGAAGQHAGCVVHLEGLVLAASPGRRTLALQDGTGAGLLEIKTPGRFVAPGQNIILEGNCLVEDDRVLLCDPPVVDDNDIHSMLERSGAVYLSAGWHPLRLAWFNQIYPYGLEVYYQGPDLPRQRIPDSALFRLGPVAADGTRPWVNGLNYGCYEGNWLRVPDYDRLIPATQGTTANFDTNLITRINDVGLQFTGFVMAPRTGLYTFTTISDDGSLLYIDEEPPSVAVTGTNALPPPAHISAHQNLRPEEDDRWSEVEGTVTFASEQEGALELELNSETGRMRVEVADGSGSWPLLLRNSRIRATGICLATRTTDGQSVAGTLLAPGMAQIEVQEVPPERWGDYRAVAIDSLAGLKTLPGEAGTLAHVRGKIHAESDGTFLLADGTGSVPVNLTGAPPASDSEIELLGECRRNNGGLNVQGIFYKVVADPSHPGAQALPLLVTVEQIKRLSREDWQRGYPVKIRGVITTVLDSGFFIQDNTRSIYVRWQSPTDNDVPRVGEFWEVEGTTFAEFAPNIQASRATRLGKGTLPEPLRPTWDQLINGSLDTEYIEVQGIITAYDSDKVTLLTRAGKISLELPDVQPQELQRNENALVRVRGCAMPVRDIHTQQVVPGRMRLASAAITVDEPAPADPFAMELKHVPDLYLFDLRAGAFQRVKIAGQIVHEGDGQFFLMDGGDGLRIIPKSMAGFRVGDLVAAVGFPDLGGPSPILREALVRRLGTAPLPEPVQLSANAPLDRRYDATLVRVQARLDGLNAGPAEEELEMHAGTRGFVARLNMADSRLAAITPGSLLELTGVYAGQGTDLASGRGINSFELLLNTAADVRVLALPPWWTVRRALAVLGGMAFVILAGLVWIALLRRQVEERSNQLAREIRRHERTERQRELEEERTRIARDLHDDLGATLTQIRFLSAVESRDAQLPETTRSRMEQVSEKSREMVASLDEIVWAVNPANDLLPNLANYLSHFAEEFFQPTAIRCRLDVSDSLPAVPLTSEVRHDLYLAVREALNNAAKHSQATEVWLRIHFQPPGGLCLTIEDNGRGFTATAGTSAGEGLANMPRRMEKIGGRFECETRPGAGAICRLFLPVEVPATSKREA